MVSINLPADIEQPDRMAVNASGLAEPCAHDKVAADVRVLFLLGCLFHAFISRATARWVAPSLASHRRSVM